MNGHHISKLLDSVYEDLKKQQQNDDFWKNAGANLFCFCDSIIEMGPESVNNWIPKEIASSRSDIFSEGKEHSQKESKKCIIDALLNISKKIPDVNEPFKNQIWIDRLRQDYGSQSDEKTELSSKSFYDIALTYICSLIVQIFPDRFVYLECLLLKYVFDTSPICSLLAADSLTFVCRLLKPEYRIAICQLVFNLCKQAPSNVISIPLSLIQRILNQYDDDGRTKKIFESRNNYSASIEAFFNQ